jgi:hypothetical protein
MAKSNAKAKVDAGAWALNDPTGRLILLTLVAQLLDALIRSNMIRSGRGWDKLNTAIPGTNGSWMLPCLV